jgi:hypothetical protein
MLKTEKKLRMAEKTPCVKLIRCNSSGECFARLHGQGKLIRRGQQNRRLAVETGKPV